MFSSITEMRINDKSSVTSINFRSSILNCVVAMTLLNGQTEDPDRDDFWKEDWIPAWFGFSVYQAHVPSIANMKERFNGHLIFVSGCLSAKTMRSWLPCAKIRTHDLWRAAISSVLSQSIICIEFDPLKKTKPLIATNKNQVVAQKKNF